MKKYIASVMLPSIIIIALFIIKFVLNTDFMYSLRSANTISKISAFQILLVLVSAFYIIVLTHKYNNAATVAGRLGMYFFATALVFVNPILYYVSDRFIYTMDVEGKLIIKTLFLAVLLIAIMAHIICLVIKYFKSKG